MEVGLNYTQPYFKGSIVREYLLVARPQDDVMQQVIAEQQGFFRQYSQGLDQPPSPQIIVASFVAKEEMEDILLRWMQRVISAQPSFSVALNNFSGTPRSNSVHLRIQQPKPFRQLAKALSVVDELVKDNGLPAASLNISPCLTIASRLGASVYESAIRDYAHREFHAEFELKELLLLKRTHQFDSTRQVTVFRMKSQII
ncbi:MAG TPA: 2'-5' RNA ligase family protein [Chitinophagaceae bacterium]